MKKNMKKQLLDSFVRLFLFGVALLYATNVKSQCSATIQSGTNPVCAGTGITVPVLLTGQPPYTFTYQINGVQQQPVVTSSTNYQLQTGTLFTNSVITLLGMTDGTGCQGTVSGSASILVSNLQLNFSITHVSCHGANDGAVTTLVTGGSPPYSYLWSNGSTAHLSGVPAGVYSVTVVDANGCTASSDVTIIEPAAVVIIPSVQVSSCTGSDGAIEIDLLGGSLPYSILWSNGSTNQFIDNLTSGTYTATVTDANGCTVSQSIIVGPFGLDIQSSVHDCATDFDLTVTGGTGPFTYQWSNGAATEDVTGLGGGLYTVIVTDAGSCSAVISATAQAFQPVTAHITVNSTACNGGLTAQITGWPNFSTNFEWSNGNTGQVLTNIPAGTYTVTATAGNSCTATASITTTEFLTNAGMTLTASVTNVTCFGDNNGQINISVTGNAPPYLYLWNTGATTQVIGNLAAGSYTVTVTDANGCTATITRIVTQPAAMIATWQVSNATCNMSNGSAWAVMSGGTSPYAFEWTRAANGTIVSNAQNLVDVPGGIYRLKVTDSNGCVYNSPDIVLQPIPFSVTLGEFFACNSITLAPIVTGGPGTFTYAWTGPNGFTSTVQNITVSFSGVYTVIVTDANGCSVQAGLAVDVPDNALCGAISGRVLRDEVDNCLTDAGDTGLAGWIVRAESPTDTFYGVSQANGDFWVHVIPGTYTMSTITPNALWEPCPAGPSVTLAMPEDTVSGGDLLVKPTYLCAELSVSIGTSLLRRCFNTNYYYLYYCNNGTEAAEDAYIIVTLDPFLSPVSATHPYTDLGGGVLRFDVGDINAGDCGAFQLRVAVSCDATLGQSHCTEAHIYPEGNCIPPDDAWSGASLRVTSQCDVDSVRFIIENVGLFDMQNQSEYIVVEDAVMLMMAPFQLDAGHSAVVAVPANGSTWRVEVDQVEFHPGLSSPGVSVEGCANSPQFSTGFVNQFPNDEADPWIDIDCRQNVGAYDPNDKQGFPLGYGQEHYIRPGTELEYLIRFQNTGTDTAFTVRIADTLSSWLDPATIRPGASSHPYEFSLSGTGFVEFLFENILLPDSNVNEAASHGFVKFNILPKVTAPLETLIENTAHIYFDFNEAVVTNTTRHRLGENFITVGLWQPQRPEYKIQVSPNPFYETVVIEVEGLNSTQAIHLQVMDLRGRVVHEETSTGPTISLRKPEWTTGMYLFKMDQKGTPVGSGKLIVQE